MGQIIFPKDVSNNISHPTCGLQCDLIICLLRGIVCCCQVASVVSDFMRPHRLRPTLLPHPWDSPGKNTGVGCHFLLQCMKGKSENEVAQSCPTLRDPMVCSLSGSFVHGIFQARVLEWGAIAFSITCVYKCIKNIFMFVPVAHLYNHVFN